MEKKKQTKKKKAASAKTEKTKKYNSVTVSEAEAERSRQIRREVWGIVWITTGILLGLAMYVISRNALGGAISSFILGMLGIVGYAVPVIFIYIGILHFTHAKHPVRPSVHVMSAIFVLLVLTFINANTLDYSVSFWQYIGQAYMQSISVLLRGGFIASILSYALVRLLTPVGANIVIAASALILAVLAFRFSIADLVSRMRERAMDFFTAPADDGEDDAYVEDDFGENFNDPEDTPSDSRHEPVQTFLLPQDEKKDKSPVITVRTEEVKVPTRRDDDYENPDDGLINDSFAEQSAYQRPPLTLLRENTSSAGADRDGARAQADTLISALASFNVPITVSDISIGPSVTRLEIQPAPGVPISRITARSADIAFALAAETMRIEAPIPGKQAVGIEIPNKKPSYVLLRDILESEEFRSSQSELTVAIGKDIVGRIVVADIAKMPHLMIAGATGSGKSVCMNTIILSIIYKSSPEDVKMILIDPKIVEFSAYAELPHLLIPVVTDVKRAASALKWSVGEMHRRYSLLARYKMSDIAAFNKKLPEGETKLPRMVIVIDELAELMLGASKEVEPLIQSLTQLGRASGIHLIVATQRPTTDIITGTIKANIDSRIAFKVSDMVNSKVILDTPGAEDLIGNGDMFFHFRDMSKLKRAQGAFVSSEEVQAVMSFLAEHSIAPVFDDAVDSQITAGVSVDATESCDDDNEDIDSVFVEAGKLIISTQRTSTSYVQQKLRIGWNRAARIMDIMETYGVVSMADPIRKERTVTMSMDEFEAKFCRPQGTTETDSE